MQKQDGRSKGPRSLQQALLRGAMLKCPACGIGALFRRYLKVADACPHCGESLHHHRADDAPAGDVDDSRSTDRDRGLRGAVP